MRQLSILLAVALPLLVLSVELRFHDGEMMRSHHNHQGTVSTIQR